MNKKIDDFNIEEEMEEESTPQYKAGKVKAKAANDEKNRKFKNKVVRTEEKVIVSDSGNSKKKVLISYMADGKKYSRPIIEKKLKRRDEDED